MFKMTRILCAAALAAVVSPAFSAEWMTDIEAAKAKAKAEGKMVLVDFTGSDWCTWCIRLRQDVLNKPEFEAYAKDKFVLAEVDLPQNKAKLSLEQLEKNQDVAAQYKIDGFPTIMVMTAEGRMLGGFVGGRSSVEQAIAPLDEAIANKPLLEAADKLEGMEKAHALLAVFNKLPKGLREGSGLREQISELDPENSTGVMDDILAQKQQLEFSQKIKAVGNNAAQALQVIEECLKTAYPQNRNDLLYSKMSLQVLLAQTEEDVLKAKATMLQMAEFESDPKTAERIRKVAEQRFADPKQVLDYVRQKRGGK